MAYLPPEEARAAVQNMGAGDFHWVEVGDSQGFIARFGGMAFVSFRGTERDFGDILTDIRFRRRDLVCKSLTGRRASSSVAGQSAAAHRGFVAAWRLVQPLVIRRLRRMAADHPGLRIVTTGHSLGAALALLAVHDLAADGFAVETALLFGCPRVGNPAFTLAATTGVEVIHHVNCCDIVPRVPPYILGFRHAGRMVYFDRMGRGHDRPSLAFRLTDFALAMAGQVATVLKDGPDWSDIPKLIRCRVFTDHRIAEYQRLTEMRSFRREKSVLCMR